MEDDALGRAGRRDSGETWPFFAFVTVIIAVGYAKSLRSDGTLLQPGRLLLFTSLMVSSLALYGLVPVLLPSRRRLVSFCLLQGAVTFAIGLMAPHDWLVLSLYSCLVGICAASFWPDWRSATASAVLCIGLMCANLIVARGLETLLALLPFIALMSVFVCTFVILFVRQYQARQKAQELLGNLEDAHRQLQAYAAEVEGLTLDRERQRMGRELHDTLAQGLAGLALQLEAVEGHLENANTTRARELVKQAKQRARTTLLEARRAINALRPEILERQDLRAALDREVDQFAVSNGIPCHLEASVGSADPPPETAQDILRFVQEGLSNVARHARATRATVRFEQGDAEIRVTVEDDGVGFEPAAQPAGLGLTGMRERAKRLGGDLSVHSSVGGGTKVALAMRQAAR